MNSSPPVPPPLAGWYPYPPEPGSDRWWNGSSWSDSSVPSPSTVAPPLATEPVKRSGGAGCLTAVLVVVGLVIVGVLGFGALGSALQGGFSGGGSEPLSVIYLAGGTASGATVTFSTPTGQEQHDVSLPLTNTEGDQGVRFDANPGDPLTILVQNKSDQGNVSCQIKVAGKIVADNTSGAAYGIATCSATAE